MNSINLIIMDLWNEVFKTPIIMILTTVLGGYATLIAHKISVRLGLQNEQELRDTLHKSAENAVNYAATELGTTVTQAVEAGAVEVVVEKAKDYVLNRSPGTLKALKVSDEALEDVIKAKVGKNVESTVTH